MSTRCQIVTYERDGKLHPVKIYKHCDGYPSGVMDVLEPFAKAFAENRGADPDYLLAQIVRQFAVRDAREADAGRAAAAGDPVKLKYLYDPTTSFTGWGLDLDWHGDIEYVYAVSPDGTIKIIEPGNLDNTPADQLPEGREVAWPEVPDAED